MGLKLKLVSRAVDGWSWDECGQSEQERGRAQYESLYHDPSALSGGSAISYDQK